MLLAAGLIWLEDRGPVFYAQQRSGWLGRPFTVYKLRTMIVQPPDVPACWTELEDQRITSVGGFLRRMRLDELPQLLNVINGDMSLDWSTSRASRIGRRVGAANSPLLQTSLDATWP